MANNLRALANSDLNLLVPLYVLLRERSVSNAARALGISQPACSAALKKLRTLYQDPLLVRGGERLYRLTPLAERLASRVEPAIESIARVGMSSDHADPATIQREFTLTMADSDKIVLARPLLDAAQREAPGVTFRFEQGTLGREEEPLARLHLIDLRLVPQPFVGTLPAVRLYQDEWTCLASTENPISDQPSDDELRSAAWVTAYHRPPWGHAPLHALGTNGAQPRIVATTESFTALHSYVVGSDRMALLPRSTAEYLAALGGVRVLSAPFAGGPYDICMVWHPLHDHDPEHQWLRTLVSRVFSAPDGFASITAANTDYPESPSSAGTYIP